MIYWKLFQRRRSLIEHFWKRLFWCGILLVAGGGLYLANNYLGSIIGGWKIQFGFEKHLPLVAWTIAIYFLIFPYLATPIFTVTKYADYLKVIHGYFFITIVSAIIFLVVPTTMPRPEISPSGWPRYFFDAIYYVDGPHNLFPSLHVSSVSFIGFVNWRFGGRFRVLSTILAVLISLSTLTTKQHAVADVLGGLLLGWLAFRIFFKRSEAKGG